LATDELLSAAKAVKNYEFWPNKFLSLCKMVIRSFWFYTNPRVDKAPKNGQQQKPLHKEDDNLT
jgi:hypothetical protein